MTTTYVARIIFETQIEATCENCGHVYNYSHDIVAGGTHMQRGSAASAAKENTSELLKDYEEIIRIGAFDRRDWWLEKRENRLVIERQGLGTTPCPNCAYHQSWMVKVLQAKKAQSLAKILPIIIVFVSFALFVGIPIYQNCAESACSSDIGVEAIGGLIAGLLFLLFLSWILYIFTSSIMFNLSMFLVTMFYDPNGKYKKHGQQNKPRIVNVKPVKSGQLG
jgi:hypothetical protein